MRIKAKPDDFAVEEVIHFTPSKKRDHSVSISLKKAAGTLLTP